MTPSHEQSPSTYFFFVYVCLNNLETFVELVGARPLHLACARPFCCSKAPLGLSLLRCASQTRSMRFERSGKGKNCPVATNFQFLKISCPSGTSLLNLLRVFQVILLGCACPKPCQIKAKRHYLPLCFSFRFCCFSSN